jgi:hypothetical protein
VKKFKVIKSDHSPIKVGDNVTIDLFKNKKTDDVLKKPKSPTTKDLLTEILARLTNVETTLEEHSAIFKRNNLR